MNFASFAGNREVKKALDSFVSSGRLPHALVLQGEEGLGKRTLARLIARAAVCREGLANGPCGECAPCLRAAAMAHPDIREITGSGASNTISVESVRRISEDAYRKPEESDHNIYLIFAGGILSEAAQNKLLKIIEEPPEGALFLFTVPSAESLLPTIRSRAGVLTLRPVEQQEAVEFLLGRGYSPEQASEAAELFGGNLGRALAYLEGEKVALARQIAEAAAALTGSSDQHAMLAALAPLNRDRALFGEVMDRMAAIFRDACALRAGAQICLGGAPELSGKLSGMLTRKQLAALPGVCYECKEYSRRNANPSLLATVFCSRIREAAGK